MLPYSSSGTPITPRAPVAAQSSAHQEPPIYTRPTFYVAVALSLIIVAGGAFAVYYLFFRTPPPNVTLQIKQPDRVLMGEPFDLTVSYSNVSPQTLQTVAVAVTVPEGVSIIGVDPAVRVSEQGVGDIGPEAIGSRTFHLIATNGAESLKHVSVALRYHLNDNTSSRFEAVAGADIAVGEPALKLDFDVPQKVFANQDFIVGIAYQNQSMASLSNAKLFFDSPQGFQFGHAEGARLIEAGKEWDLGTIYPEDRGELRITGRVPASQQSFFGFGAHLQVDVEGQTYTLGSQSATVNVSSAPLSIVITANGKPNYVASRGEQVAYTLAYNNNSEMTLQNVVIQASLEGQMFDFSTLFSPATFDSVNNTLIWDTANTPALATVRPGQGGRVDFRVKLATTWPITRAEDRNFTLAVRGKIQSLSVPAGTTAEQTVGTADLLTKVRGETALQTTAYYKDPDPTVVNKGPYPPKVNQPTEYTIHWIVKNWATDLADIRVSAVLQSGAKMVQVVKSTAASVPMYDPQTGEVTWHLSSLPANQGVVGAPVEAVFRIQATPAVNQVDRDMSLINETLLTARDSFASTTVTARGVAKSSAVPDDSQAAPPSMERHVQP